MTLRGSSKKYSDKYSELVTAINEISQATVKEEGPFLNGAFSVLRFCSVCEKGCNPSGVDKLLSAHSDPARLGAFEVELIWENAGERERLEIFSKLGCGLFPCVKLLVDNLVHELPLLEPANGIHALLGQKAAYMQEMIFREQELRQLRYELAALRQQQEKSIEEHKGVVFEMEVLKKSLSTAQQRVMEVEAELMTSQQQYKVLQDVGIKEMEVYDGRFADLNAAIANEKQVEKREREREREKAERELNQEREGRQTDKKAAEREIEKGRELVAVLRQQVASVECKLSLASGALVSIKEELQLERARLQETTLQKAKAELDVKVGALLGEELKKEKERVAVLQRRVDELEDKVRGLEEKASDWERMRESIQGEGERVQEELKKELRKKEREVEKGKDRWTTLQLRVDELEEQARDWERERMRIQGEMERVRVSIQGEGERVQEELKEELRKKEREVEKGKDRWTTLQLRVDELEEQARDWERERMRIQGEMESVQKELKTSLCQKETAPLPASSKPKVLLAPLPASSSKPRVISVSELEEELLQVEKCARENFTRETQRVSALEDELRKKREWVGVVQEFIQEVDIVRDEVEEVDGGINGMLEDFFERERSRPARKDPQNPDIRLDMLIVSGKLTCKNPAEEQERAGELIQRLMDEHAEKDSVQSAKCKSERELQEEMSRQEELTQLKTNISTRSLRATTVKTHVLLPMPPPTPPTLSQHREHDGDWCVTHAHDDLHERLRGYEKRLTQVCPGVGVHACIRGS
jgi:chromosome segregation ATPase